MLNEFKKVTHEQNKNFNRENIKKNQINLKLKNEIN